MYPEDIHVQNIDCNPDLHIPIKQPIDDFKSRLKKYFCRDFYAFI